MKNIFCNIRNQFASIIINIKKFYQFSGDIIDMLTLVNSAINFILYCTMSRQFRKTFKKLFCKSWKIPRNIGKHICMENNGNTGTNHTVTQVTQV